MKKQSIPRTALAGLGAGAVNGLFGAGGGMVLVPLLTMLAGFDEDTVFPTSVSVMLPVCIVSLAVSAQAAPLPWQSAFPYLLGSAAGGILAGLLGQRVRTLWLHRILGVFILWGGVRYLW